MNRHNVLRNSKMKVLRTSVMYRELDKGPPENIRTFSEHQWHNVAPKPLKELMGTLPNVLRTSPVCWTYSHCIGFFM